MNCKNPNKSLLSFLLFGIIQFYGISIFSQIIQQDIRNNTYDLTTQEWKLWGYRPETWKVNFNFENLSGTWAEYSDIPVEIPSSVRGALLKEGVISDWNVGLNSTQSEWIENRHWLFVTKIPDSWIPNKEDKFILHCNGLDYKGVLLINGKHAGHFSNSFVQHNFDITSFLKDKNNTIAIAFECAPRHLGHITYTSQIKDWKPRFNYGWDWMPRIVQTGITDAVWLSVEKKDQASIDNIQIITDADKAKDRGILKIKAELNKEALKGKIEVSLFDLNGRRIIKEIVPNKKILEQKTWDNIRIKRWWPNGVGKQNLYILNIKLSDKTGKEIISITRKVGFKNIKWLPCDGAREDADPWICSVNNKPIFLQGVNWTPIRPNYADLKKKDYKKLLSIYKSLGVNVLRIWGGGFAEKQWLYDMSDEMGIMLWQDFPLSSSNIDNNPPEGLEEIEGITTIVKSYLNTNQHHVSILLWCAGNELYDSNNVPLTDKHKMIGAMKDLVSMMDPSRRFVDGSPSGPNASAVRSNFGSGNNWDTHGPWTLPFSLEDKTMISVNDFWSKNDALFISEAGVPGAMSSDMIKKYSGGYNPLPASIENPLWRNINWWIDWDTFIEDNNGQPTDNLETYVSWSQKRQSIGLSIAVKNKKDQFPRCGGFIIWMGHDSFPCMINTSIIDFDGNVKPAAIELSKIWKNNNMNTYKK